MKKPNKKPKKQNSANKKSKRKKTKTPKSPKSAPPLSGVRNSRANGKDSTAVLQTTEGTPDLVNMRGGDIGDFLKLGNSVLVSLAKDLS